MDGLEPNFAFGYRWTVMSMLILILLCVSLLATSWLWYPRRMAKLGAAQMPLAKLPDPHEWPAVSIVLATREPTENIRNRLRNLSSLDYDGRLLQFVVALDSTVQHQYNELEHEIAEGLRVTCGAVPGKSSALNAGVAAATHDLLFFVDTAQTLAPDALRHLVRGIAQADWGAATATLQPTSGDKLMDSYWRRELAVRLGQTRKHSVICVTGCAYILRRRFWKPMPAGLICDDLWSTYAVVANGGRVGIIPDAVVTDPRTFTREQEFGRRLRTMTGLLQFIQWFPEARWPSTNPIWLDFVLHKLMRPATPILVLLATAAALLFVWSVSPIAALTMTLSSIFGLALVYIIARRTRGRLSRLADTALFSVRLLLMPLRAIAFAVQGDWDVWHRH